MVRRLLFAAVVFSVVSAAQFKPQHRRWWALQKVAKPAGRSVDDFIRASLAERGLKLSPPADRITLIRRATLDLTGLPPAPEEVAAFLADETPEAFARVVDRLLASPRYGERWARHWLDLARYADSEGFKSDETRPNIWRYRDYVIESVNHDTPYDRFVREQIAGDELYPNDPAALLATGFNRHFPDESNARNLMQRRQELLNDITDTVWSVFLGLTYGCARCHDHKFDPILQKDYYRLQAFFANTRIEDNAVLEFGERRRTYQAQRAAWEAQTEAIRTEMARLAEPMMQRMYQESFEKFPPEIQDAVTAPPEKRTPIQWQMFYKARPQLTHDMETAARRLKGAEAARWRELKAELTKFDPLKPEDLTVAQAMIDNDAQAPATHVLGGGVYDARGEEVQPGFLSILDAGPAKFTPLAHSTGRRAALAHWLASSDNPFTARVMVNRIWHYHFGRGLVGTPSDFGLMGERPTHPKLLDWLAATFVEQGWSMKKMHRLIMLSETYQQSSAWSDQAASQDPQNKLLWRFNRRRLEGEAIRDSMLAVSGLLNLKMGGPGVFPPLPPGMVTRGGWKANEDPQEAARRSVYVFVRRNTRYPMFEAFDMPDTHESCGRRGVTTTAPQALELLNNEVVSDWARAFAQRLSDDQGLTREAQIDRAYRLAYQRTPTAPERQDALAFLDRQQPLAGDSLSALADFCHMLMNSSEFLYMN